MRLSNDTINLAASAVLIADQNVFQLMLMQGMLRAFGAKQVLEAKDSAAVHRILGARKIDVLICDAKLPPHGGLALTRLIRLHVENEHRTIPIFIMTSDTREATIKAARDAGANMVIAKPMSPASLYDRLK